MGHRSIVFHIYIHGYRERVHTYASVYAFRFGSLRYSARTHWLHVIPMISPNSLLISLYYTFFFLLVGAFFLSSSEQYNFYEASTYTRIHILGRYIRTYSEQLNESCSRFFLWQCKRCCLLSFLSSDVVDSFSQHVLALASLSLSLYLAFICVLCAPNCFNHFRWYNFLYSASAKTNRTEHHQTIIDLMKSAHTMIEKP